MSMAAKIFMTASTVVLVSTAIAAPAAADSNPVITELRSQIPKIMAESGAVGLSIALVDGDTTVWTHGFGWADKKARVKVTPTTMFQIGSASKTFTAAAIMQLVEQGKVDLDAPVTRYVPELRMRPRFADNKITVRDLMTHHSGVPQDVMSLAEFGAKPDRTMYDKVIRKLNTMAPERPAGQAWAYSNLGITLLQGVIENVTGRSFIDYTDSEVFARMGMRRTTFDDAHVKNLARSYAVVPTENGTRTVRRPQEYINIMAAGSVVSNAREMATYLKTMIAQGKAPNGNRLLRRATVAQMIAPQPRSPWDVTFFRNGLVWWRGWTQPWMSKTVNHGGDTTYFHSMVMYLPEEKLGVFVSINTATPTSPRQQVIELALKLMLERKTGEPVDDRTRELAPVAPADTATLDAAAGRYANNQGMTTVSRDGERLLITGPGKEPAAYTLRTDGWFGPDGQQSATAYKFTTIEGQRVMLERVPAGWTALYAQALPADYAVPAAWQRRVGTYRVTGVEKNVHPDGSMQGAELPLRMDDGVLMLGNTVLLPEGTRRASSFGPTPGQVMRGAGFLMKAKGNSLSYYGVTLVPQD